MLILFLSGGWSTDGITAQLTNNNTVQCTTTHLTSFSVLVGPSGSETTSVSSTSILVAICFIYSMCHVNKSSLYVNRARPEATL